MLQNYSLRFFAKADKCPKCADCCWSCHHLLQGKDFFCDNCHKIQPPTTCNNYFAMFKQPESFDINLQEIQARYRQYQKVIHPDHFFNSSDRELDYSDKVAQSVNKGYETLSDPLSRAEYILGLYDRQPPTNVPPGFLDEVLTFHERIDDSEDPKELMDIMHEVDAKIKSEEHGLSQYLKINNDKIAEPEKANEAIVKMRYFQRIRDLIKEKLPANAL